MQALHYICDNMVV